MTTVAAITAPVILVCAGAAIDYSVFINAKTDLRAQLDAAAVSSAHVFIDRAGDDESQIVTDIRASARSTLAKNGGPSGDEVEISVNPKNYTVSITVNLEVPTTFLRIAGIGMLKDEIYSAASAEIDNQPVCILALKADDGTGIEFEGSGEMKAKGCVVWSNATGMQSVKFNGGGKVTTSRLCARGRAGSLGRFSAIPAPESDCAYVADPMKEWTPPENDGCTYHIDGWVTRTTAQIDPGVYCGGLRVDAKNILMSQGIYVMKNGPLVLRGSSKIVGKNVGVLLEGADAKLDIDGKAKVELTASTEGPMAGIVIASSRDAPELQSTITGRSDLKIGGVIYLPTHDLSYFGESDTRAASPVTTIISNTLQIGGESYLEVKNEKSKAKYAPVVATRNGSVRLID